MVAYMMATVVLLHVLLMSVLAWCAGAAAVSVETSPMVKKMMFFMSSMTSRNR